ncbi:hypothetical protein [Halalkalicoccus jeotgali]|uniref:hypothetical protein n=1 Tax=Halalkalicoccus jeotgali TaxID=413810 RepID=UPI00138AD559|nr:hypothetical protein [Halalkalicoccus jeotgali]
MGICTIDYSLPFYRHTEFDESEKEKERESDKRIVRYSLYGSSIIEYLSIYCIFESLSPQANEKVLINELERKSQYQREGILGNCSIIDNEDLKGEFKKVRKTRNEMAHSQDHRYEFEHYDDLNRYISDSRKVISFLVENLYGASLDEIISRLKPCFTTPTTSNVEKWPTAQLVSTYSDIHTELESTVAEEGGFVELREKMIEYLEEHIRERGYDPENAYEIGSFVYSPSGYYYVSRVGGGVNLFETEEYRILASGNHIQVTGEISINRVEFERITNRDINDCSWYIVVFIGSDAVRIYPKDDNLTLRKVSTNNKLAPNIEYEMATSGVFEVSVGVYIDLDTRVYAMIREQKEVSIDSNRALYYRILEE